MSTVSSEITNLQNQTAVNKLAQDQQNQRKGGTTETNKDMFLSLMLEQLKHQDPTEPTDNTEWLAQLAQYSSLEQMTQMNEGLQGCMSYISALYQDMAANSEITQTLSLIGKEVTVKDPEDESGATKITGKVSEASFEDGTGKVKIDGKFYSIANIIAVRDGSVN